jgi:phosphoribosylglycinamide formyltransferase-1
MKKHSVAVFASGNGTNAINLIQSFQANPEISIDLVLCNKSDAPVVEKSKALGVEVLIFSNEAFESGLTVLQELDYRGIEWIVLAGFLRKIPLNIIRGYQDHIINIHPSLLPDFGGKGMYGMHVHRAVVEAKAQKSGISIHLVNEEFDKGRILAQFETAISPNDTPEQVATKIHTLEQLHFPTIVAQTIINNK